MQRYEVIDGMIQASIRDFEDAKDLYDATSKSQITKLTDAERRLAEWLAGKGPKSINDILMEYMKQDGTQYGYHAIYKMIKGIKGKGGLLDKVPGLMMKEKNREEAFELPRFNAGAIGSIVSLKQEAYERFPI